MKEHIVIQLLRTHIVFKVIRILASMPKLASVKGGSTVLGLLHPGTGEQRT